MPGKWSIWAKLRDLTAIALILGLVVAISTWVVDARQQHAAAALSMSRLQSAFRAEVSGNAH